MALKDGPAAINKTGFVESGEVVEGYELLDGPNLELYGNDHKEIYSEVWLPVKKSK